MEVAASGAHSCAVFGIGQCEDVHDSERAKGTKRSVNGRRSLNGKSHSQFSGLQEMSAYNLVIEIAPRDCA